jgi:hypothetical protein
MGKRKWTVWASVFLGLLLITLVTACGVELPKQMSYQGRLTDSGGNPINGSRNLVFRLYTAETGGSAVWEEPHNGVQVDNGLFNVVLGGISELDEADFHQALFLEIDVAGQTLSPRQPLHGAPYAFSLVPGAVIRGAIDKTETYSSTLTVANFGDGQALAGYSSLSTAIAGRSDAETGWGVLGWAAATSGNNIGVYGRSDSSGGQGVWGYATEGGWGVYGLSTTGTGVRGLSSSSSKGHGVYAQSLAPYKNGAALYALNSHTGSGVAIWGTAFGSDSTMVLEQNSGSGDFIRAYQTNPGNLRFRVEVDGDVRADGTFIPGGADMAEMLPAVAGLEPRDVLVIGAEGQLMRSSATYATTVAGVYSTKPGVLGGAEDGADVSGKVPLAIVGVVPAKVCAANGPILPGDLLVTSSLAGHAMKATEIKPGTILGKALGELKSGEGVIDVLVTLQ